MELTAIPQLPLEPSREQVLQHIGYFKATAMNLAMKQVTGKDAQYLEPRELKSLTDIVLNLEDSIKTQAGEGEEARAIVRMLDKYAD